MFLTAPNLHGIHHGFFTRNGGVSTGIYGSLNCGWGSADSQANVAENRNRVAQKLGTDNPRLLSLYQVHGNRVITVDKPWPYTMKPQADAMVTRMPGLGLGILTADCVPVLFADRQARVIGAAHAGWKGAMAGVLEETLKAMDALGARRGNVSAAIGPCIGAVSYEVGAELRERFTAKDKSWQRYFLPSTRKSHYRFDIRGCVAQILRHAGLSDINTLENDTYIEENDFFSFRRTTHRGETDYGRQISAILLTTSKEP